MNWIAKSYPLPTLSKRTSQIIKMIEQSNSALDSWINFFLNESVFLSLSEKENIDYLISNLFEYTILWRGYFESLLAIHSDSENKESNERTFLSDPDKNDLQIKRNLYRAEREILFQLITSTESLGIAKKVYVKELNRNVAVPGLMFLVSLYNDYCLRLIRTQPKTIKASLHSPFVS